MNQNIKDWKLTVGLEVHIQLSTKSKMFCKCPSVYGAPPNSLTCPICLGLPGALPAINQEAVMNLNILDKTYPIKMNLIAELNNASLLKEFQFNLFSILLIKACNLSSSNTLSSDNMATRCVTCSKQARGSAPTL